MDQTFRTAWNQAFTPALYARYTKLLEAEVGPIPYRVAESPLFLPEDLRDDLFRVTRELLEQLAAPAAMARAREAIPPDFDVPRCDDAPGCMTVDFAIVEGEQGRLEGRVVELQAFPSLYGFTIKQAQVFDTLLRELPGIRRGFHCFDQKYDFDSAIALFREAVLAGGDPEEVVLLEIEPDRQKTRTDFVATRALLGIDAVCVTEVIKEGRRLCRTKDGRKVPIKRIYNRVVFDELLQKKPKMAFAFTDDLDVTWCCHPNWYWMWSKFSLPVLEHPWVPKSHLLSELKELPEDLSAYVLKPLFSFAGSGVKIDVTEADLRAIPPAERRHWLLQRKVTYARALKTPEGIGVAAEVRILCLRAPRQRLPEPFMNLVRLSRGKMLGIDYNKGLDWVGSTVALWPKAE
ncbi:MAG: hypothetical protein IRZ16_09040 [Myxococcaceae bacterium]|nr:hypothetical protein [Myxococcaceae bacterium]